MSVDLKKKTIDETVFKEKALVQVTDGTYSVEHFKPNGVNHRLIGVKGEALERLNQSMQTILAGNSQIYYTMLYKDEDRIKLMINFWNGLIETEEFKNLPPRFKQLEFEQMKKVGPKSRFKAETLKVGFQDHINVRNKHIAETMRMSKMKEVAKELTSYFVKSISSHPDFEQVKADFYTLQSAKIDLPRDSNSGDPYFIHNDKKVAGVEAGDLEFKLSEQLQTVKLRKKLYYTFFKRVQQKGNSLFPDLLEDALKGVKAPNSNQNVWLDEKNRVVQGDSRAYAILGKSFVNLFTKCSKNDPIMAGWADDVKLNDACRNMFTKYHGKYRFKSFDAENYDATTDPDVFRLALEVIYNVVTDLGLQPERVAPKEEWIEHFLKDPTITPWGIFGRVSLPSGHIMTNLVGTIANLIRGIAQTAEYWKISIKSVFAILYENYAQYIPLLMALGDDAVQLVPKDETPEKAAELDNLYGFGSNAAKTDIEDDYFHFLQKGNSLERVGYYPVCRALESVLFQEYANQYTSALVSVNCIAVVNNCKYADTQRYLIKFCINGDPKYRLGTEIGFSALFKEASKSGKSIAALLDRDWDPKYAGVSIETFGEGIKDTLAVISEVAGKAA